MGPSTASRKKKNHRAGPAIANPNWRYSLFATPAITTFNPVLNVAGDSFHKQDADRITSSGHRIDPRRFLPSDRAESQENRTGAPDARTLDRRKIGTGQTPAPHRENSCAGQSHEKRRTLAPRVIRPRQRVRRRSERDDPMSSLRERQSCDEVSKDRFHLRRPG